MVSAERLWRNLRRVGQIIRIMRRRVEEDEYGRVRSIETESEEVYGYIDYGVTDKEVGVRGGSKEMGDGRLWVQYTVELDKGDVIEDSKGRRWSVVGFSHLVHQEDGRPVYNVYLISLVGENESGK